MLPSACYPERNINPEAQSVETVSDCQVLTEQPRSMMLCIGQVGFSDVFPEPHLWGLPDLDKQFSSCMGPLLGRAFAAILPPARLDRPDDL